MYPIDSEWSLDRSTADEVVDIPTTDMFAENGEGILDGRTFEGFGVDMIAKLYAWAHTGVLIVEIVSPEPCPVVPA